MDREQNGRDQAASLKILLIGSREEDYFIIHDLLRANSDFRATSLDQAHTLAEAQTKLATTSYHLVMFEYESSESEALQIVQLLKSQEKTVPFLFLTEYADNGTLPEIIEVGAYEYVSRAELNRTSLARTIRSALSLHQIDDATPHRRRKVEDAL